MREVCAQKEQKYFLPKYVFGTFNKKNLTLFDQSLMTLDFLI